MKFQELPSFILVIYGAPSFVIAAYFGLMFSEIIPNLVKVTNNYGFKITLIYVWGLLALYAMLMWWFGCVATRCHKILYERWFK